MSLQDKETLITNEKRQMLGEPALFPLDNFVLSDQDILTSEFLKNDLEAVVQECTENGRFIVLNEMSVNAYAYSMKAANVVALSYGSLYHCLYAANLLMLSEEYYPEIGDVRACYSDVNAQDYPPSVGTGGEISFYISGDDERRNTGYIIAAFAMKYMVYHEIGHHECGHLQKYNYVLGLCCGETGKEILKRLSADEYKMIEMEADIFAIKKIVSELDALSQRWSPYFEVPLGHLELTLLLITALIIVKENLNEALFSIRDIDNSAYLPTIVRLVICVNTMMAADEHLQDEFRQTLILNAENKEQADFAMGQDDEGLKNMLEEYLGNAVVAIEQIYADIFMGRHDAAVFQSDLLAGEWWKRLE